MSEQWRKAVVDRIEDGRHAVLLVDGREERIVPAEQLPDGATEGTWLNVQFHDCELVKAVIDQEQTQRMRSRVREKMERLRKRGQSSGKE